MKIHADIMLTLVGFIFFKCADGQPSYFGPLTVYVGMQTGAYLLEKLEEKEFLMNKLPVNWMTSQNDSLRFQDYSIFIQYKNRRFVSIANGVKHIAQSIHDVRQPFPKKTYVHLDKELWLESQSFEIFIVNTQGGDHHYSNRIFITIPETNTVYAAQFELIPRAQQSQPTSSRRPHTRISDRMIRMLEGRLAFD